MKLPRGQAGFSLIEVMCALLILAVGLAGLVQGISTALGSNKDSELHTTAALLAEGRMETLRADGLILAGTEEGECSEGFSRFRWKQSIEKTSLDGLFDVTITIEGAKTGQQLFELKTLLFDAPWSTSGETGGGPASDKRRRGGRKGT